ncbi:V-type ATP synthase subunit C [Halomarina litorea]|uniref:V-type ATP synthase subunit C n=1 Tax=Halomarina litorea TaxID=2961595 RepID=UPI0020C3BE3D|nr:V-type ATP synthase subunit C [Halomarina sp. BCD28]
MSASGQAANYEYVTARARSRRAALFDADDYRKLVRMGPGEIARFMEETEYEEEMNALGSRYSGVDLIEYALNRNLAKHFDDMLRFAEGKLYDYIARYLRKFDAWNVKTVVRGIYAGTGRQSVEDDLIRAGEFSERRVNRLVEAESIEAVVEQLDDTIFGDPLAAALDEYEESGVLVPLENAVDRAYYRLLLSDLPSEPDRATRLYIEFLEAEIDFRNIRNALRLARSGADIDPAEYYIPGGRLFDEGEIRTLVNNPDQLVERIRTSPYGDDLDQALDELDAAGSLIEFELALERALLEYSDTLSSRYPLSVCPVLAYILAKEREVDNIRAIARGKEAGLSEDEIEEELVVQ